MTRRRTLQGALGLLACATLPFGAPPAASAEEEPCRDGVCAPGQGACPAELEAGPLFLGYGDDSFGDGCDPGENCEGKVAVRGLASYRKGCAQPAR